MARSRPAALGWSIFIGRLSPRIFFERVLQHAWLMVLDRLLHVLAAVAGEHIRRFPSCTTARSRHKMSLRAYHTRSMRRSPWFGRSIQDVNSNSEISKFDDISAVVGLRKRSQLWLMSSALLFARRQ